MSATPALRTARGHTRKRKHTDEHPALLPRKAVALDEGPTNDRDYRFAVEEVRLRQPCSWLGAWSRWIRNVRARRPWPCATAGSWQLVRYDDVRATLSDVDYTGHRLESGALAPLSRRFSAPRTSRLPPRSSSMGATSPSAASIRTMPSKTPTSRSRGHHRER